MDPDKIQASDGGAGRRPTTYAEITPMLVDRTRLQLGPVQEFVGEFGWGMVVLMIPTLMLAVQSLVDLASLKFDIPPAKVRYDGTGAPGAFVWKEYAEVYLGSVALVAMSLFSLRQWARALRNARRVEDLPTSTVRAAAQGEIELRGTAVAFQAEPILSHLSGTPCVWHWYQVKHRTRNSKGQSSEVIVAEGQSPAPVLLDDGTGIAVLRLSQAQRTCLEATESSPEPGVTHSERLVREGDEVFAWGTLQSWDASSPPPDLDRSDLAAIEAVRAARYADQDAGSSMALVRPMRDGSPVAIALNDQNPLVANYRFNAKVCVFFLVLSLVTIVLFQRVAWVAVH